MLRRIAGIYLNFQWPHTWWTKTASIASGRRPAAIHLVGNAEAGKPSGHPVG